MSGSNLESKAQGRPSPLAVQNLAWLRRHRRGVLGLILPTIAATFALDLLVPGYAIAGLYLIPLLLVAFAFPGRLTIAVVCVLCLGLTIFVMVLQGRTDGQNILLVALGVLGGLGLVALGFLYDRLETLYQSERAATARAESLNAVNGLIHSTLDFDEIMRRAVEEGVRALAVDAGTIEMREGSRWVVRYQHGFSLDDVGLRLSESEAPNAARAAERAETFTVADMSTADDTDVGLLRSASLRSVVASPLLARGAVTGCLLFYGGTPRVFDDSETDFARKLAAAVSLALENARLYEAQRRIATTLQENFIHPLPEVAGLELGIVSQTATEPELIGGDFSEVFERTDGRVCVLIGDVAGKGVRAAGLTETVRSMVRAFATIDPSPAYILAQTNELLLRYEPDEPHVTAFLTVLDPQSGNLTYASAGHPAALHISPYSCRPLGVSFGPPLHSFPCQYHEEHLRLSLDDYLLLYTDGVTEARRGEEQFGEKRLLDLACGLRGRSAQEVAEDVRAAALEFAGSLRDDLHVVCLRLA
jgi:serine phosphatase RsbU (regulator of sigma subunit)